MIPDGTLKMSVNNVKVKVNVDIELLIHYVREEPRLWDQRLTTYHNRGIKRDLWESIGQELSIKGELAHKTWENLRDTFRRKYKGENETKSGQGASASNKWPHFNSMLFLKDMTPKNSSGNLTATITEDESFSSSVMADEESENESVSACNSSTTRQGEPTSLSKTQQRPKRKRRDKGYEEALDIEKRKISLIEQHFSKKTPYKDDDDYSFLIRLLPTIKQLNQLEKMKLRMKILEDVTGALEAHNFANDVSLLKVIPSPNCSNFSSELSSPNQSPGVSDYPQHSPNPVLQCATYPGVITAPTGSNLLSTPQYTGKFDYTVHTL